MHPIDYQHLLAQLQYQNIQAQNLSQIQVNSQFNFMNMNQIGVMSNNSGFNGTESRIATIPARQDAIVNTASDTDSNSKIMIGRLPPKQQQHADPAYIQKRQAHIQMERRYRKDLNSSIQQLNSVIPVSQVNPATNKTKILQRAAEYIKFVQSLYPELTMICSAAAETNSDQLLDNGSSSGTKPGRKRARKQKLAYSSTTSNRSSQCTMLPPDEAQSRVVENQIRIQQQEEKIFQLTKRLEAATAEQYDMWTKQYQVSLENDKTKGLKEGVNEVNVGVIDGGVENGLTMELSSDVKLVDACPPNPFQLPTSFSFPSLINATLNESEIGVLNANHLGCSNSQMVLAMAETELQNLVREPAASGGKQK
ncbi:hypothetical protein BKA69DRAFT_844930 [Paraphysoderma sedebokerense]|nr:hypothetical protein BKA69DRAFT_866461 [Paraphysoderma sedebokerense]KAI9137851.1 hypothetical protein BKA69DRAFT_844930 [Paraphysoderma sedebokerense]